MPLNSYEFEMDRVLIIKFLELNNYEYDYEVSAELCLLE